VEREPITVEDVERPVEEYRPQRHPGSSLALSLALVALVFWFGFQAFQMVRERGNLGVVRTSQDSAIQEAEQIRAQFESLISKLSDLASKGHAGAKMVLDELQNRGVGAAPDSAGPPSMPTK
jgi:hypothetical protein